MECDERFIKTGEAAKYLMISKQTLRNWQARGLLVPKKQLVSGHRLYTISQLEEFKKQYHTFLENEQCVNET